MTDRDDILAEIEATGAQLERAREMIGRRIIGQEAVVEQTLIAILCGGHALLVGAPGLAKTRLVETLGTVLGLSANRVQFTPDLMPADVTGQMVLKPDDASFEFRAGPIFTNLFLADEINRTPPKTQSALLEAMEERQVSVEGTSYELADPHIVIATQNPVEYEGTYPLPEAQLDRFLMKLLVGYPSEEQEVEVLVRHHRGLDPHDVRAAGVRPVATAADLLAARQEVARVTVEPPVMAYVVALARATRNQPSVQLGVSPRGAAALMTSAKAWAWLSGRPFVTADEVKAVARPVLRHRIMVRPELELEGSTADGILDAVLAAVPAPR